MHFAFGRVRRKIALLRTCPFVVGQFIARQLPKYFIKLHTGYAAQRYKRHRLTAYATQKSAQSYTLCYKVAT